jgi:TonB-dependent receptor
MVLMAPLSVVAQDANDGAADEEEYMDEIFVVGTRGAIERAQNIKKLADTVVEAVTFEDLGEFSDESIADALQRVPGVQIERNDQGIDGDRVSIRGLGPRFVAMTINGRTPTLKPLDSGALRDKQYLVSTAVRGQWDDESEETDGRISGIYAFKNSDETVGAFLSGMWTETTLYADEIFVRGAYRSLNLDNDGDGVKDGTLEGDDLNGDGVGDGIFSPSSVTQNPIRGEKNLISFSGGLQFRPNDSLEFNVDALYSDYELLSKRNNYRTLLTAGGGIYRGLFTPESLQVENNAVTYMNPALMTGNATRVRAQVQNLLFDNISDFLMAGFNAKWTRDNMEIRFDYSTSEMHFEQDLKSIGTRQARSLDQSQIRYDATGGFIPVVSIGDQINDPSIFSTDSGVGFTEVETDSEEDSFRLDFVYDINDRLSLLAGLRWTDTLVDVRRSRNVLQVSECTASNGITGAERTAMFDAAWANGMAFGPFLPDENIGVSEWPYIDHAAGAAAAPDCYHEVTLRGTPAFEGSLLEQYDTGELNTGSSFWLKEKTFAYYLQLDFDLQLGDTPVSGNLGVRAAQTEDEGLGSSQLRLFDPEGIIEPIITGGPGVFAANKRWDYLPSLNTNFALRDNMALRLSVQKTLTRPDYVNLVTRESLARQNPDAPLFDPSENGTGSAANADLAPYSSWSYDATLEYYTENGGALYASYFYKDVSDYILRQENEDIRLPGHDDILWDVNRVVNFSDGTVKGFELGLNQPLSFLLVEGFGVTANFTSVDSSFDKFVGDGDFGFPGASGDNGNLVAYYDEGKWNVRMAYVYRSEFLSALGRSGTDRGNIAKFTKAQRRLDLKATYRWSDNLSVTLSGTNLTGQDRENFVDSEDIFRDFVARARTVTLTLRAKF